MRDITLEELLEAGCHFGHQVNRRNPKANEFIFEERSGVHIIDLVKTREGLLAAAKYIKTIAADGGSIIVVGTKRQAKGLVEEEVNRARTANAGDIFYVTCRWVGGTLTNFTEVSKNVKKLEDLTKFLNGNREGYTKHEVLLMEREKDKLRMFYEGIQGMKGAPTAIFVIDTHNETTVVKEAQKEGVPLVGIVDTNSDPVVIDYSIPANDDAVGSIKLILSYIVDAWIEGKTKGKEDAEKAAKKAEADSLKEAKAKEKEEAKKETKAKKTTPATV